MTSLANGTAASGLVWHAHPDVWFLVAALLGGYFLALKTLAPGRVPPGEPPASRRQIVVFCLGVAALWLGADWPMHELSEDFLFSAHMVQHTLFSLVAPPLLLLGTPAWLVRAAVPPGLPFRILRRLTRPVFALILFNAVIAITHWPALVDLSLRSEIAHLTMHTILFTTATLMWTPVVSPVPELATLSPPGKMLYLFLQSIVPTVPASFLTFADKPLYSFYESAPRLWDMSPVTDQMVAGLIMKIGGGLLLWTIIATLFFRWSAREERGESDEVSWEDFERELAVWDLRK